MRVCVVFADMLVAVRARASHALLLHVMQVWIAVALQRLLDAYNGWKPHEETELDETLLKLAATTGLCEEGCSERAAEECAETKIDHACY